MNTGEVIDALIHSEIQPTEGFKLLEYFHGIETRDKIKITVAERVLNHGDLRDVGLSQCNVKFCRYADSMINHIKAR